MKIIVMRVLDALMALLTPLVAVVAALQARAGGERLPLTFKVWDLVGVTPTRHHYYQPVYNGKKLLQSIWERKDPLHSIHWNAQEQLSLLKSFNFQHELESIPISEASSLSGEFYHNQSFGPADAEMLYNIVRHFKPQRVIEIGSGYSTRMMKKALDANRNDGVISKHICIEPFEMPWLELLGVDQVIRARVEDVDPGLFEQLEENDLLFIDSSHVLRTGGDVFVEYLQILPRLKKGVLVHIHDIFLPYEYPKEWIVNKRRFWTEQYLLQAFLAFNSAFEILSAIHWLAREHPEELARACPVYAQLKRGHGSFWIRRLGSEPR